MRHAIAMMAVMLLDHWLANTERVVSSSVLGLLFNGVESILLGIKRLISRR